MKTKKQQNSNLSSKLKDVLPIYLSIFLAMKKWFQKILLSEPITFRIG